MLGEVWVQCTFCNILFEKRQGSKMGKMICPRCQTRLSLKEMNDIRCRSCQRRTMTAMTECPWCKEKNEQMQKAQMQKMKAQKMQVQTQLMQNQQVKSPQLSGNKNAIRLMKDRTERRWLVYKHPAGCILSAQSAIVVGEGEAASCKIGGQTRWLEVPGEYLLSQICGFESQTNNTPSIIELDEPVLFFDAGLHEHSWSYNGTAFQIHQNWRLPIVISYQYMLDYKLLVQYPDAIQSLEEGMNAQEQLEYVENWLKKEIDEILLETTESFFYCMYEEEMTVSEIKQDLSAFHTRDTFEKNILYMVKEQLENRNAWIQLVQLTLRYGSQDLMPIETNEVE